MTILTIGLLHPGAMGSTLGQSIVAGGHRVVWAGDGRSDASKKRASDSQLEDVESLSALVKNSDFIFSVCPPHAALDIANSVVDKKFRGIFVDCNAVSTNTTDATRQVMENSGADFVDGGIIGPPAHRPGSTRLYLSGEKATEVVPLLAQGLLPGIAISKKPGDASVLKMAYASYTKGHSALLLLSRALASSAGLEDHLLKEWSLSQPGLEQPAIPRGRLQPVRPGALTQRCERSPVQCKVQHCHLNSMKGRPRFMIAWKLLSTIQIRQTQCYRQ